MVRAPLPPALGLSPSALPFPKGQAHIKNKDLHFLRGGTQSSCPGAGRQQSSCLQVPAAPGDPQQLQRGHRFPALSQPAWPFACKKHFISHTGPARLPAVAHLDVLRMGCQCRAPTPRLISSRSSSFSPTSCHLPPIVYLSPSLPLLFFPLLLQLEE